MRHHRSPHTGNPGYVPPDALPRIGRLTATLRRRGKEALRLRPGAAVLDVGCGVGSDTVEFAELAGAGGRAVGVDIDAAALERATEAARQLGQEARVRFVYADASALPFTDGRFDACWSERLLQHVAEPAKVLSELVRVARPGARVAVADADWHSLSIHHPDAELERRFVAAVAGIPVNPSAGRSLSALSRECGLVDVAVELFPLSWTDCALFRATSLAFPDLPERLGPMFDSFMADLAAIDRVDGFFAHANMVLASGTVPA